MKKRNVSIKEKSTKQGPTSAKDLTIRIRLHQVTSIAFSQYSSIKGTLDPCNMYFSVDTTATLVSFNYIFIPLN